MKAYLSAVLEDLVGEYVLNITKDNLRLAALRGNIKLENVELDGDLIGSHIFGAIGLTGFGVLSCWARTLKVHVPWTNLNDPTTLEIHGMHLICVPLLPNTANRTYFGPQTLRTKAKRSALARYERNYFSGRIAGEGPGRVQNENDGNSTLKYHGRRRDFDGEDRDDIETSNAPSSTTKGGKDADRPALRQKLMGKIYENLVSSILDIHIRCEVPDEGIDHQGSSAFGITLKSLSVRNVSETAISQDGGNINRSEQYQSSSLPEEGGSSSGNKRHKKVEVDNFAMYWDDNPSYLISESDLLHGRLSLSAAKCQRRISEVMKLLSTSQDPGAAAKASLSTEPGSHAKTAGIAHDYICSAISQTMLITLASDAPENSLCFAEILPMVLEFNVTSRQYDQYQHLRNSVLSQQRFDTMLHRRPDKTPFHDPCGWWRYAIACVRHEPTSRSWTDVQRIVDCRQLYLGLVAKNLSGISIKGGFHGGLTDDESLALMELEDMLPLETLLSFHLIAMRQVDNKTGKSSFGKKRSLSTFGRLLSSLSGSVKPRQSLDGDVDSHLINNASQKVVPATEVVGATQTACTLHTCKVKISLFDKSRRVISVESDVRCTSFVSGTGKADLTFDVLRFEVFEFVTCQDDALYGRKILAIRPDNQDDFDCRSIIIQSESDDVSVPILNEKLDESVDVRLPPNGVACRVSALLDQVSISLDIISHPATVIYNKPCAERLTDIFSLKSHQVQNNFLKSIRSATTPLAQKAHMAVLYPNSLLICVNAHAPQLWIPVSNDIADGALFCDAGKLKMELKKAEQSSDTDWIIDVSAIQIMLTGESSSKRQNDSVDLDGISYLRKDLISIVHPFEIAATGHISDVEEPTFFDRTESGACSERVTLNVGRIRVNLVDVEVLAKSIGRFYASGVTKLKNESSSKPDRKHIPSTTSRSQDLVTSSRLLICFEKIEAAIEQYSSQRTYLVELLTIKLDTRKKANMSFSRLSIKDFTIVQLGDSNRSASNVRYLKPSTQPQHQLLRRKQVKLKSHERYDIASPGGQHLHSPQTPERRIRQKQESLKTPKQLQFQSSYTPSSSTQPPYESDFINGVYFHDGVNLIDEVEIDVTSAIIKVTPTSISDCAMWVARAVELIRIASKGMERRAHKSNRKYRMKGVKRNVSSGVTDLLSSPLESGQHASKRDSSVIVRVAFNQATMIIGRPASEFSTTTRSKKTEDYVIQFLSDVTMMTQSIENENETGTRTFYASLDDLTSSVNPDFQHVDVPEAPILRPAAIDFRVVWDTVGGDGSISSQSYFFNCEAMDWILAPHDTKVVTSVVRKTLEKLDLSRTADVKFRGHRKGTRIATQIRLVLQSLSITLTQPFTTGMRPFIQLDANDIKVSLVGCIDAMNGEVVGETRVRFYNPQNGFEDLVESNRLIVLVDQIPNELVVSISVPDVVNINVTETLIEQLANLEREKKSIAVTAIDSQTGISFVNDTGIDVVVGTYSFADHHIEVPAGNTANLDSLLNGLQRASTLSIGAREYQTISNLPLFPSSSLKQCKLLVKWFHSGDSALSQSSDIAVDHTMQYEKIRPGINDVMDLEKGLDILSSRSWSTGAVSQNRPADLLWHPLHLKDDDCKWIDMSGFTVEKDDDALPGKDWMWINDWEVEINEDIRQNDLDGWEYATDFDGFTSTRRSYMRGDLCRRRRWTRTKVSKSSPMNSRSIVWFVKAEGDNSVVQVRSHLQLHNNTRMTLSFFGHSHHWNDDQYIGNAAPGDYLSVPLLLASATHISFATLKETKNQGTSKRRIDDYFFTEPLMVLTTTEYARNRIIRTQLSKEEMKHGILSIRKLHFVVTLKSDAGIVDVHIEPALRVVNLLPCELQFKLGEISSVREFKKVLQTGTLFSLKAGQEEACLAVDCTLAPHISIRVPGFRWSQYQKIVNRTNSQTWQLTEEEELLFDFKEGSESEFKSIVHFERSYEGGDSLDIVMSIEMGHSPTIRFYAQFIILDKTLLNGLHFIGGFKDFLQSTPEMETLRKSYLLSRNENDPSLMLDMEREGHEWTYGMLGMTLFFSREETISLSVVGDEGELSQWSSLIDLSNIIPETTKTTISIDRSYGTFRYELAYSVTLCPSVFSRTRMITFYPQYQIVNLLQVGSIYIAQDSALSSETCIPSLSSVYYHLEDSSLEPKIRLCSASGSWTRGCIQLDKIGVTAMRIPLPSSEKPMVVQAEVRMASKKEDSVIVVTVRASSEKSNPLYLLKNNSHHTMFCRQKLDLGDAYIWTVNPGESICYGFDDPLLPHELEWNWSTSWFTSTIEVDAMGSKSTITTRDGIQLTSTIQAHRSTKVILFSDASMQRSNNLIDDDVDDTVDVCVTLDVNGIMVHVDDKSKSKLEQEIILLTAESWRARFSQRQGFHEIELKLTRLKIENFIPGAEFPVFVNCPNDEDIPFFHLLAVRSIQEHNDTTVVSYCGLRMLDINICLDRKTAETIAHFLHPLRKARDECHDANWSTSLTSKMRIFSNPSRLPRMPNVNVNDANTGRIYLEELHLHPIQLYLTFTQEGLEWNPVTEGLVIFQLIRGMASIADAPLFFTSFVVSNAFESPSILLGIISEHYSSQLASQILSILGSLVIFRAPVDLLSSFGTGARDYLYEPVKYLMNKATGEIMKVIRIKPNKLFCPTLSTD